MGELPEKELMINIKLILKIIIIIIIIIIITIQNGLYGAYTERSKDLTVTDNLKNLKY